MNLSDNRIVEDDDYTTLWSITVCKDNLPTDGEQDKRKQLTKSENKLISKGYQRVLERIKRI